MSDSFRASLADLLAEHDVQLKVEVIDALLELFEEQGGELWNKGRAEGFVAGLESAKTGMLEHAGQLFARNNDDAARFLRIFANETIAKQIIDAKKRTK